MTTPGQPEHAASTSAVYQLVRDELIAALANVDDAVATTVVPACPAWTVRDVAAHLVGLNADVIAEVQGPLGSDAATHRQVSERSMSDLPQILEEWTSLAPAIEERFAADPARAGAFLADLVIHVYDLAEMLDQPTVEASKATPMSAHRYVPLLQQRLAEQLDVALTLKLGDGTDWPAAAGASAVTLATDPHSFLRGVTGRLTRAQVEALDWSSDPTQILDQAWNQYGPFRK